MIEGTNNQESFLKAAIEEDLQARRELQDFEARNTTTISTSSKWTCSRCTFQNFLSVINCSVCSETRNWSQYTHYNQEGEDDIYEDEDDEHEHEEEFYHSSPPQLPPSSYPPQSFPHWNTQQDLHSIICTLTDDNLSYRHRHSMDMLKQLISSPNPPIQSLMDSGCMVRILQFLNSNEDYNISIIAAYILTDISSHSNISYLKYLVHDLDIIPKMINVISNPKTSDLRKQCFLILGNIASETLDFKNIIIQYGTISLLIELLTLSCEKDKHIIVWVLTNICSCTGTDVVTNNNNHDQQIYPNYDSIRQVLPIFSSLIQTNNSPKSLTDLNNNNNIDQIIDSACLGLSYLSENPHPESVKTIIEDEILLSKIFQLLSSPHMNIQRSVLNIIHQISIYNPQIIIDHLNILPQLIYCLNQRTHMKKICLIFNEIFQESVDQIQSAFNVGIIPLFIQTLNSSKTMAQQFRPQEKTEEEIIIHALSNAFIHGNLNQKLYLVEQGCIQVLSHVLNSNASNSSNSIDFNTLILIIDAFHSLLQSTKEKEEEDRNNDNNINVSYNNEANHPKDLKALLLEIDNVNGVSHIENLQDSSSEDVYHKAVAFLETWYGGEEENDENEMN